MKKSKKSTFDTDRNSRIVRTDLTIKDLMEEKPTSRWDVEYWNPKYEKLMSVLNKFKIIPLEKFIVDTVSGHRGKTEYVEKGGVRNIEAVSILSTGTGIDPYLSREVKIGGVFDTPSRRTKVGNLLFARSGVATAGRSVLVSETSKDMVIGGHILKVDLNNELPPEYIQVYLKTSFGWAMLDRVRAGVGALVLDKSDIEAIPIPILSKDNISKIRSQYKEVMESHDKAIKAKVKNDTTGYKKNIETAEKMLKDLIAKTEAVIRGERKDVV